MTMEIQGDLVREEILAKNFGNKPSEAIAKKIRVWESNIVSATVASAARAPRSIRISNQRPYGVASLATIQSIEQSSSHQSSMITYIASESGLFDWSTL